jgi:hypothetical protein
MRPPPPLLEGLPLPPLEELPEFPPEVPGPLPVAGGVWLEFVVLSNASIAFFSAFCFNLFRSWPEEDVMKQEKIKLAIQMCLGFIMITF